SDTGPWNPGGNFCPNCVHKKSPEGINSHFWKWDWKNPDRLECPYCHIVYPNKKYPDNGTLHLPRLNKTYTFHILKEEHNTDDWRLGEKAGRFVNQPIHVSFSGSIRSMKLQWALDQVQPLGIAYALTGKKQYAKAIEHILVRMANVYPGYPLQSYFQDVVDADPGYAVDNCEVLPTVFKRNACIGVYDGRHGYGHEKTTTRVTKVATGLWGSSRISKELTTTGVNFLHCFQGYDLVKKTIAPQTRKQIEQGFLLELYLDTRAYEYVTNKAGSIRAARIAFGLVYNNKKELASGLEGFHKILESQFHPDGSMKESPIYGHKPIGEDLWQIPEMLRGTKDLYGEGLYRSAFQALADIATPLGMHPPLDDSYEYSSVPQRTADIAAQRCNILIPGPQGPASEFARFNTDLSKPSRRPGTGKAFNHYYEGRHLACLGYGSGRNRIQMYVLGEDGLRGHRHAGPLTVQLYAGGREIFPDLGYICDHPGNQWVKATPSHQTVTVNGENAYPAEPSVLHGFCVEGTARYADLSVHLKSGATLRRALTLLKKQDGLPILIDVFDVEGGQTQDYNSRVLAPPGSLSLNGPELRSRKQSLYQEHSFYPLLDFQSAGKTDCGWTATWGRGKEKVRAHIRTPCSELITYRSPGWRSQFEIPTHPRKYFDTLVLRNRKAKSRFVVVYEILGGRPAIQSASLEDTSDLAIVNLNLTGKRRIQVRTPGLVAPGNENIWNVKRS
ncbi:MAG: heparinase II/III family protein, partial [bacterium]|nr:heparinase II/III family protein [bacterium]